MASATEYGTSVAATVGAETGGGKSGTTAGAAATANAVAGTIGQDYYTAQVIYPDGIQVNPEDGTPIITKRPTSPKNDGEKTGQSVSGNEYESKLVRQKSRAALMSTSHTDAQSSLPGITELNKHAKIKYFDGSGEDVTPVPLFVPPEPEEDEKGEGEDDGSKKKPRKNVMQTFLKMATLVYGLAGLGSVEESKLYKDKFPEEGGVKRDSLAEETERALLGKSKEDEEREKEEAERQRLQEVRDRDRMKGIEAFPERGKGLPGGKSMDGEGSPASSGGRIIDILLKETDTQWMFTLTGTCAEIEDDENVPTKKGESNKESKDSPDSESTQTGSKDEGGTSDEPPPSIKGRKSSKDASTETDGTGEVEKKDSKDGDAIEEDTLAGESVSKELQPDKSEEKAVSEEEKSGKMKKAVSHSDTKDKIDDKTTDLISHHYDLNQKWSQTIDFPRKKKGTQSEEIATSDIGCQVVSKDLLFQG